jgi:hypothetical protein
MPELRDQLRELAGSPRALPTESIEGRVQRRARRRLLVRGLAGLAVMLLVAGGLGFALTRDEPPDPAVVVGPPSTPPTSLPAVEPPASPGELPSPDSSSVNDGWERLDPGPLAPRDGHSVVWTGDEMIVWGGRVPESVPVYSDGAAYDPDTSEWRMLPDAPISGRADHVAVWTGDEMIVWSAAGGAPSGAAYHPTTDAWRTIAHSPLDVDTVYAGVWTGKEMLVYGQTPTGAVAAAYDPVADTWRTLPPTSHRSTSTTFPLMVWTGEVAVVLERLPGLNDMPYAVYDPQVDEWHERTAPEIRIQALGADVLDGHVYVGSHYPGQRTTPATPTRAGMASYDPRGDSWDLRTPFPVVGCETLPTLLGLDNLLFESHCGVMALYDPDDDAWTEIPTPTDVTNDVSSRLVWTGDVLLSWDPGIPVGTQNFGNGVPAGFWSYRP